MKKTYRIIILSSIALISLLMHFNHFSKELMSIHVWRQTQTQSTIVNFYEEDFNILNPSRNERADTKGIFRMEFPLMQWLVAGIYKIFGNHLIISRICMFIIGLFSVLGMYILLSAIFKKDMLALIGAWTFNFSPSFYYYTINPIPDNLALCCSIWGLVFFFRWLEKPANYQLFLTGTFLSIGALCKLPFILYFIVPCSYFILLSFKNGFNKNILNNLITISSFILLPFTWYISVIPQWQGNGITSGMLKNETPFSTILYYLKHNLISTLPELLLNYGSVIFFLGGFYFLYKMKSFKNFLFPVFLIWSAVIVSYFFFEINMIAKIHDYYLFPFYPLLFILVSYGAYNMLIQKNKFVKYLGVFLLLILPITAYIRMHDRWNPEKPGFNKDLLIYKDELRNTIPKGALCIAGNDESHFIFFYYIDKKGWAFHNDEITAEKIKTMVDKGAQFLYSDSRNIDENSEIAPFLKKLVLEKGSIRVYSLN